MLANVVVDLTDGGGGADPAGPRYRSPLGDRREASVPCWSCRRPTLALDATCDPCTARMAPVARVEVA